MSITIAVWYPEYETGNYLIDEQHKSLFSTINALNNAMLEGQAEALLDTTIEILKDYTTIHFNTEEQFMLEHNYPGYPEHKKKHEILKAKVLEFNQKNYPDLSKLTISLSHFLTEWLIDHIKDEDQRMIAFCRHGDFVESKSSHFSSSDHSNSQLKIAHWSSNYETGYDLIDEQHKSLFHAINALNSAMLQGRGENLLEQTLKALKNYTTIHFETEEKFMEKYGYPNYQEHKAKHQILRNKVEYFYQLELKENNTKLTINLSHFLTDWLIHHIREEDKKMIDFLRQIKQKEDNN